MVEVSREAVHAALAEPRRLDIVDALAAEDLSPSELGARTGQPSNLLAHHLGVLEDAGVVRRRHSDGDGRRSYLTLAWENPIVAASVSLGRALPGSRVVFVCSANTARSQMAASLLAAAGVRASSAGTRPAEQVHPMAAAALAAAGLAPLSAEPTHVDEVATDDDLVVAVCDNAYEELGRDRVALHWSIPDPVGGDEAAFLETLASLTPRVGRLADALTAR